MELRIHWHVLCSIIILAFPPRTPLQGHFLDVDLDEIARQMESIKAQTLSRKRSGSGIVTGPIDRSKLYAEFAPLIKKLIYQYGACPQLRDELTGEIHCRF